MGGDNPVLTSDSENFQHVDSVLHRLPIRRAAHDDGDLGLFARHRRILTKFAAPQRTISPRIEIRLSWQMNTAGRSVALIGFMGAGKSAVGRELAARVKLQRFDTDEMIRRQFGSSIPEIFASHGEKAFRDAETEVLRNLRHVAANIIVTGGGIVLRDENVQLLHALGMIIWLDADEEILWQRASRQNNRPLLQTANPRQRFSLVLQERLPFYQATADHRVDTSRASIADVVETIMKLL
jgi:shikimate kinase